MYQTIVLLMLIYTLSHYIVLFMLILKQYILLFFEVFLSNV